MTDQRPVTPAPAPLEAYAHQFDALFDKLNQRDGFRRSLEGVLLPTERHKSLTGLANTEPVVGAQPPRAQALQWFLSESTWSERAVQERRLQLLLADPLTAPTAQGVLAIEEHGDRKAGDHTAHVGRQYLSNLGKIDNGVVSVTSRWADERVYSPVDFEPDTPEQHFAQGKRDPAFRTKLKLAVELVRRALQAGFTFRAVVADSCSGEDRGGAKGYATSKSALCWRSSPRTIGGIPQGAAGRSKRPPRRRAGRMLGVQANGSRSSARSAMAPRLTGGHWKW